MDKEIDIVRPLGPEDIRPGRYVVLLGVVTEHPVFRCAGDPCSSNVEMRLAGPVRLRWLPPEGSAPMRVVGVSLPTVLVRRHDGDHAMLDVRRHRLGRVSKAYGRLVFERLREDERRARKRRRAGRHASDD